MLRTAVDEGGLADHRDTATAFEQTGVAELGRDDDLFEFSSGLIPGQYALWSQAG